MRISDRGDNAFITIESMRFTNNEIRPCTSINHHVSTEYAPSSVPCSTKKSLRKYADTVAPNLPAHPRSLR